MLVQISVAVENCGRTKVLVLRRTIPDMNQSDIKDIATAVGGVYLGGGIVNIRDVKVLWFETQNNVTRMGESSIGITRQYLIPANGGRLFFLRFSVSSVNGMSPINDFRALEFMFRKCAVALTLKDYSQFYNSGSIWSALK